MAAIAMPLPGVLFLKRQWILGKRFGFVTPGEMLAYYFKSELIRVLVVIVAMFFSVPYLGLQLLTSGFLFSVVTNGLVGVEFGMWVLTIVVVSYVASGGLRTVAYVDVLQGVLLASGIVVIGFATLTLVGGWERLLAGIAGLRRAGSRAHARGVQPLHRRSGGRSSLSATAPRPWAARGPAPGS